MRLRWLALILSVQGAVSFSWKPIPPKAIVDNQEPLRDLYPQRVLSDIYTGALNELHDLELQPLCHRNAARLLVKNCQLLDGKDEATVLIDSGRVVRDFVDSYAASLAICDLERGSFAIPKSCTKFRETTLSKLSIPQEAQLHVSTYEIDRCLEGLAQSDSAWSTWVSYRHKALGFCEAARADNDKAQQIYLHQRLTKVLERLTVAVESQMESHLQTMNRVMESTASSLADVDDHLANSKSELTDFKDWVEGDLVPSVKSSFEFVNRGHDDAQSLQHLLASFMGDMERYSEDAASAHESALRQVSQRVETEAESIFSALTTAATTSNLLSDQIERSMHKVVEITSQQNTMEQDMLHLQTYVETLSTHYVSHSNRLSEAQTAVDEILGTLDSVALKATTVQDSLSSSMGIKGWWPYIVCPVASVILGSYGMPPSTIRNVILAGLGEAAGLLISSKGNIIRRFFSVKDEPNNTTDVSNDASWIDSSRLADNFIYNSDLYLELIKQS